MAKTKKIDQYACGDCGNELYEVYRIIEDNKPPYLMTKCTKCQTETNIVAKPSELELQFGNESTGRMCIF